MMSIWKPAVATLCALLLSQAPVHAQKNYQEGWTWPWLQKLKGTVFYTSCMDGEYKSILIFPSSPDPKFAEGWYVMYYRDFDAQYGGVGIENGKWSGAAFTNLNDTDAAERGRDVVKMMQLPFTALQKKDFHLIFDTVPKLKCP